VNFIKEAAMPIEPLPDDVRNVWQNQPLENTTMPLAEIHRKARQFEKRIRHRNLREYLGGVIGIAAFTFYLFKFPNPLMRAGSILTIAGVVYVLARLYKQASPGTLPADLTLAASVEFHRRELARQRDLLRSVWRWYIAPIVPGLVVFSAGASPHPGLGPRFYGMLVLYFVVFGFIIWLNYRGSLRLDRQIAELNNLESQ
jgi:hypothetical protein